MLDEHQGEILIDCANIKSFALIWKNRENKGKDRFSTPYGEAAERAGLRQLPQSQRRPA
jgi:hypothetical protein